MYIQDVAVIFIGLQYFYTKSTKKQATSLLEGVTWKDLFIGLVSVFTRTTGSVSIFVLHVNSTNSVSVTKGWRMKRYEYYDESFIGIRSHVADVYELSALRAGVWKEF